MKDYINMLWANEAGAYEIARAIYVLWGNSGTDKDFLDWCRFMYEDAPYDDYEWVNGDKKLQNYCEWLFNNVLIEKDKYLIPHDKRLEQCKKYNPRVVYESSYMGD